MNNQLTTNSNVDNTFIKSIPFLLSIQSSIKNFTDFFLKFDIPSYHNLSNYSIIRLSEWENQLDHLLPNFPIQDRIDQLGKGIKKEFALLEKFNHWLDQNGEGGWYQQLASLLYKLPIRSIRNVIRLLYRIIENALYAAAHPMKATTQLAKNLIYLVNELLKPEIWSAIGASAVGVNFGQGLGSGNPLSIIGFWIGGAMLIGGLGVGVLKEALEAESDKKIEVVKIYLYQQVKLIPEAILTGFLIGLLMGGIQRGLKEQAHQQMFNQANQFIKDHQLPQYSSLHVKESGEIILRWEGIEKYQLEKFNPMLSHKSPFPRPESFHFTQQHFNFAELNMSSVTPELNLNFNTLGVWKWGESHMTFNRVISLKDFLDHRWQSFRDVIIHRTDHTVYG